jgi:DNA-binding SARP family transcriptional activator
MDFRLLGPLEVRSEGQALPLGGPKQRAVLAMLLLQRGEVVSTDRLIDELWGERPPKTVDAYIQNCISRLRGVLGREVIETRRPGYVLRVEDSDVDALRFEQALEAARELDPPERAAALREALGLWRGAPLADLAFEEFAQSEIARLEELRLSALEVRIEAELELGRQDELLPELTALASRHPARERLRYLQMLALYRSGRQREALRVYQEARRGLVEELGLEPGEELRALERMIISHDPSLGVGVTDAPERDRRRVAVLAVELPDGLSLEGFDDVVDGHGGTVRELLSEEGVAVFAGHDDDVMRALRAATTLRAGIAGVRTVVNRVRADETDDVRELLGSIDAENIVIGADALALVPAAVDVVPHESGAFRVIRFDPNAEPFARRYDAPFVGRSAELERLGEALRDGSAKRLAVVGDAGVGKTRLIQEFVRRVRQRAEVVGGRCAAYGEGTALLPLFQILRQVGNIEAALAGEPDADRVAARLLDPSAFERSEGFWAFRRLLETLARAAPLIVVLEDLHAAAGAFLDLVDYLDGWTAGPVLLLCIGRVELLERRPEWREGALVVEPIADEDARTLAATLSGLDGRELDHAVEAAEGNPLFLEQLVATGAQLAPGAVPPTVEALIASRLDALPASERAALERAAVAGRSFWRAAVEDATPADERDEVGAALISLVRRRLVRPERSELDGEDGFRFHHALIRDVAYEGIPQAMRAGVHESVARSLDGRHPALDAVVGHHLEQAAVLTGDRELAGEAGRRLGAAGLRALKRVDNDAAAELLSRAMKLTGEDLELEWAAATAAKFTGDPAAAQELLGSVGQKARAAGNRPIELRALIEQVWSRLSRSELSADEALRFLEVARDELTAARDDVGLWRAWYATSVICGAYKHQIARSSDAAAESLQIAARAGAATGAAIAALATNAWAGPTPRREAIEQCRSLLEAAGTPVWQSFVLPNLALLEAIGGRFDEARRLLAEARLAREEFSERGTIETSWSAQAAEVELLAGDAAAAGRFLEASELALTGSGDPLWLAVTRAKLAETRYRQERFADALRLSSAAQDGVPADYLYAVAPTRRVRAKALARDGRADEARTVALANVDALAATDALNEYGEALAAAAEVHQLLGDRAAARRLRSDAALVFDQKGNTVALERLRREQ